MSVGVFVRERNSWKLAVWVCVCRCQSTHCLRIRIVLYCIAWWIILLCILPCSLRIVCALKRRWMFFETSTWEKLKINKSARTHIHFHVDCVTDAKERKSEISFSAPYHTLTLEIHEKQKRRKRRRSKNITSWCYILENCYNNDNWHAPFANVSHRIKISSAEKTESKIKSMQKRVSIQIFAN